MLELFILVIYSCVTIGQEICKEIHPGVTIPDNYKKIIQPTVPLSISVTFQIMDLPQIYNEEKTLKLNMIIWREWQDLRIKTNVTFKDENTWLPMPKNGLSQIWIPDLYFQDLVKYEEPLSGSSESSTLKGWYLLPNGYISHFMTSHITTRCKMDFSKFPMDQQECKLKTGSPNLDVNHIVFKSQHILEETFVKDTKEINYISIADKENWNETFRDGTFSMVGLTIRFTRPMLPFVLEFYLPCAGMVVLSWISFIISPTAIPGRTTLLVTLFLVLTNYFGNMQAETPKSQDLSALALYALICQAFVFFASVEFAFLLLIERIQSSCQKDPNLQTKIFPVKEGKSNKEGREMHFKKEVSWNRVNYVKFSNNVDKFALCLFFILFTAFNIWYFMNYK